MINIFRGAGVVTPSKPPPPYEQILPLPNPCFKMFLERSLTPTTPIQLSFTATPSPSTTPSPPKNFDHTPARHSEILPAKGRAFGKGPHIKIDFFEIWY